MHEGTIMPRHPMIGNKCIIHRTQDSSRKTSQRQRGIVVFALFDEVQSVIMGQNAPRVLWWIVGRAIFNADATYVVQADFFKVG